MLSFFPRGVLDENLNLIGSVSEGFPSYSSSCTTTELSRLLTSCVTAVKTHVIKYYEKVYERSGKISFDLKHSSEVIN